MKRGTKERLQRYVSVTKGRTEALWSKAKKWFLLAALLGAAVGLAVTGVHYVVYELAWGAVRDSVRTPVTAVVFPTVGLFLSGWLLSLTRRPSIHDTEEVIEAYHEHRGAMHHRSLPAKVAASMATLALGGNAGLEGPSIYIGASIGSWMLARVKRWGFTDDDVRALMLAGSAAGVSAIFKAPLTGIVFALEVPYMDDMAREALIPSLVASVSSYLVLASLLGIEPLFYVAERHVPALTDMGWAVVLGLLVGVVARAFVLSYRYFLRRVTALPVPLAARTALGGLAAGTAGALGLWLLHSPMVLGTGYEAVQALVRDELTGREVVALLVLKTGAVVATLASGAAGGAFVPMIVLGATTGALFKRLFASVSGPLFPVVGMAAFLAAGYNTPIAAAVFVAETTGGAGYIIPGLVAAAVAYTVAGRVSVSSGQRWRREGRLERRMNAAVSEIMTKDVVSVDAAQSLACFVSDFVIRHRHKSFPVVSDGRLVGMVALSDVREVPRAQWEDRKVGEVMERRVVTAHPDSRLRDVVSAMTANDVDRVPVVDPRDPTRMVGIVSSTDALGTLTGPAQRADPAAPRRR